MSTGVEWRSSMDGKDYEAALQKAVGSALEQAGIIVEGQAAANTPVDTGRLRGSISWRTRRGGRAGKDAVSAPSDDMSVHIGTAVEYAQHVEYGTRRMGAQPYLRPALHAKKGVIVRDFGRWVQEYLRRGK